MQALAVTGKQRHIKSLHEEEFVSKVSPVQTYSVPQTKANTNEDLHPEMARYHPKTYPSQAKVFKSESSILELTMNTPTLKKVTMVGLI